MAGKRLRIAFVSDLSGSESLAAYCSRILVPLLSREHSIELFSDSFQTEIFGAPHFHYLKAYERHRTEPFDVFFYQLEDGKRSRFVRSSVGMMPGVTWFHDLFFQDLGPEATHTSPWERSIAQFFDPSIPFADRSVAPHQLWPRAYREVSLSPVALFSSRWALAECKTMISDRIEPELGAHRAECLNIPIATAAPAALPPSDTLRVAALAGTGHEGRAHKFLAALKGLSAPWALTWLIDPTERAQAEVLLREFDVGSKVTLVAGRSIEQWSEALAQSHVALHLRTSSFGHLAPHLQHSLAAGRLTIVSSMAQGEDLPDDVVCKVTPGISESVQLQQIFESAHRIDITKATAAARAYVRERQSPERIADNLSGVLRLSAGLLEGPMRRWDGLFRDARKALLSEVEHLMSSPQDGQLAPYDRIMQPAISELFGG
jgi:hypothetical protein